MDTDDFDEFRWSIEDILEPLYDLKKHKTELERKARDVQFRIQAELNEVKREIGETKLGISQIEFRIRDRINGNFYTASEFAELTNQTHRDVLRKLKYGTISTFALTLQIQGEWYIEKESVESEIDEGERDKETFKALKSDLRGNV
jgi:hypothetical protein